jgi:hypothetical protein
MNGGGGAGKSIFYNSSSRPSFYWPFFFSFLFLFFLLFAVLHGGLCDPPPKKEPPIANSSPSTTIAMRESDFSSPLVSVSSLNAFVMLAPLDGKDSGTERRPLVGGSVYKGPSESTSIEHHPQQHPASSATPTPTSIPITSNLPI